MPYITNQGSIRDKAMMTLMSVTPICDFLSDDPDLQSAPDVLGPLLTCAVAVTAEEVVFLFEDIVNHPDVHSGGDTLLNARQTALIAVKESAERLRNLCVAEPDADAKDLALANRIIAIVDPHIKKHQFHPRNGILFEHQDSWGPIEVSCSICGYTTALESPTCQEWMLYSAIHGEITDSGDVILPERPSNLMSSDREKQDVSEWKDRGLASLVSPAFSNKSVPCPPSLRGCLKRRMAGQSL